MTSEFVNVLTPYLPLLRGRPLSVDLNLRDLGLDSMKSIDLLFSIEDAFGVALSDDELNERTFATAGNLRAAV